MAKNVNQVLVEGNVTQDVELRLTNGGISVVNLTIAVNQSKKGADGEWEDIANFIDVTLFGDLAERAADTLTKGDRVLVTGRLAQRQWETPEGDKRSKIEIIAEVIAPSLRYATATITRVKRDEG